MISPVFRFARTEGEGGTRVKEERFINQVCSWPFFYSISMFEGTLESLQAPLSGLDFTLLEVFTLPPLFRADSGRTPSDSTYPECQFFGSGTAGIVR
jgi:hypothetical protein